MTLTNRLLVFFLTLLAVVLVGFSTSLYVLASIYLHGVADRQLDSALDTLTAAAEIRADGVEWEPAERRLHLGTGGLGETLVWFVTGAAGNEIDRSGDSFPSDLRSRIDERLRTSRLVADRLAELDGDWRIRERSIESNPSIPRDPSDRQEPPRGVHARLSIVVGSSTAPMRRTLAWLGQTLAVLSIVVWGGTLLVGRAVCRRALRPVRNMAEVVRSISSDDLSRRLPPAGTGDELDELATGFNDLLSRLQESFERQRRFTGEASHQLRTPLAALLGQIEVALRRERSADEYRSLLTSLHAQGARLTRIVEALLFLARADSEAMTPDRQAVDLGDWLSRHTAAWGSHPRAGDLTIDETDGVLIAEVQPDLLGEAVDILWDNACKYSPPGTPIRIALAGTPTSVEISVADRGPGIAAEDVPNLFTPFFRSPDARRRGIEGLGLGLAIARRIAIAMGGSLRHEAGGEGACFRLSFPRVHLPTSGNETAPIPRDERAGPEPEGGVSSSA